MNIAFIIVPVAVVAGEVNGIRMQAITWKNGLELLGHKVSLVDSWGIYDWRAFDIIHLFGSGLWLNDYVCELYKYNTHIVISPIIDTVRNQYLYKIASFWGCKALRITSSNYSLRTISPFIKLYFARSEYEAGYIAKSYNISRDLIQIIPLSYRFQANDCCCEREPFCFHLSSIYQKRKNVERLVKAAIKYNFRLVLAGNKGNDLEYASLDRLIGEHKNIEVLGRLSEEDILRYYSLAKVFALPSLEEGVGLVALEAAACGCEIVITSVGGPKEYYGKFAYVVNPLSIDDIGLTIKKALITEGFQPKLKEHVINNFSLLMAVNKMQDAYMRIF